MAYWDGGSGNSDGSRTPSQMRQLSPVKGQMTPESEEQVIEETEDVVRNFLFERYTEDLSSQSEDSASETAPQIQEFMNFTSDPLSQASQVGRQLAIIGDDINRRYNDEFNEMIQQLRITEDTAYDVFARVAKKIFAEGINWGRIAALLCFAYRIVQRVMTEKTAQFGQFLKLIVHHVVRFIREKIVNWIVQRGGWNLPTIIREINALKNLYLKIHIKNLKKKRPPSDNIGDALNYSLPSSFPLFAGAGLCVLLAVGVIYYLRRGS